MTDNEVNARILAAADDTAHPGHDAASRIVRHNHLKVLYQRHPDDVRINPEAGKSVFEATGKEFGAENVRRAHVPRKREPTLFPVLLKDGRIALAEQLSEVLQHLPAVAVDYVFIRAESLKSASAWLDKNRDQLIRAPQEK